MGGIIHVDHMYNTKCLCRYTYIKLLGYCRIKLPIEQRMILSNIILINSTVIILQGKKPIDIARLKGHSGIVRTLRRHGN